MNINNYHKRQSIPQGSLQNPTKPGGVSIGERDEQIYLGFVISNKGENMANIRKVKHKLIGTVRQIINKLNSWNLQN